MTDKVQKIREKVVEIVNSINPFIPDEDGKNSDYEAGKLDAATRILQIIDSLEEPVSEKKCMFTKDSYTDEDRKVLCEDCKEKCEYSNKDNLFDNAKFGDMFLTTENKQAVFLRFAENAEYKFAFLYVEDWGNVQVFRHNGKAIYNDAAHSIISKKEDPVSEELEKEIEKMWAQELKYRDTDYTIAELTKQDYEDCASHFAMWQKEQMMAKAVDAEVHIDAGGYPYIPQMELYDYDKDEPLAKEGDKYKVVLIKEE